jgi:hypothetical protein
MWFGPRVFEWSVKLHAVGTVGIFEKQASNSLHDADFDRLCNL